MFSIFLTSFPQGGNESETKAVFIVGTLLQSQTLDFIHSIVESSDFQHCTILCTVPENVHSFARLTEIGDVSPFGELSLKLREWMGNMVSEIFFYFILYFFSHQLVHSLVIRNN